jgi:hypothetical protein
MRWRSAHSNQLRLGGAGVEVRDEKLVVGATRRSLIFPGMSKCKVPMDSQLINHDFGHSCRPLAPSRRFLVLAATGAAAHVLVGSAAVAEIVLAHWGNRPKCATSDVPTAGWQLRWPSRGGPHYG